jgi:hypothetical protein
MGPKKELGRDLFQRWKKKCNYWKFNSKNDLLVQFQSVRFDVIYKIFISQHLNYKEEWSELMKVPRKPLYKITPEHYNLSMISLSIPESIIPIDDNLFLEICRKNPDNCIERTRKGEILLMARQVVKQGNGILKLISSFIYGIRKKIGSLF